MFKIFQTPLLREMLKIVQTPFADVGKFSISFIDLGEFTKTSVSSLSYARYRPVWYCPFGSMEIFRIHVVEPNGKTTMSFWSKSVEEVVTQVNGCHTGFI